MTLLDAQQIITAFDNHMKGFEWRLYEHKKAMEIEAYRQLIDSLVASNNEKQWIIEGYERVFKDLGVDPRSHPAWAKR